MRVPTRLLGEPTMPDVGIVTTRSLPNETPSNATGQVLNDRDGLRGDLPQDEQPVRSPQEFYAEVTKRPDIREILRQLADR